MGSSLAQGLMGNMYIQISLGYNILQFRTHYFDLYNIIRPKCMDSHKTREFILKTTELKTQHKHTA